MDRLCLNAQCSLITTTTRPTPYFHYFFDEKIFVTVDKNVGMFTKHIWQLYFGMTPNWLSVVAKSGEMQEKM